MYFKSYYLSSSTNLLIHFNYMANTIRTTSTEKVFEGNFLDVGNLRNSQKLEDFPLRLESSTFI